MLKRNTEAELKNPVFKISQQKGLSPRIPSVKEQADIKVSNNEQTIHV